MKGCQRDSATSWVITVGGSFDNQHFVTVDKILTRQISFKSNADDYFSGSAEVSKVNTVISVFHTSELMLQLHKCCLNLVVGSCFWHNQKTHVAQPLSPFKRC